MRSLCQPAFWVVALALLSSHAWAQPQAAPRRIGFLGIDSQMQGFRVDAFRDRLPELAADLAAQKVEVLVTAAPPAVRALQKTTSTIPIVIVAHDPIGMGFVSQLARPGGNITGIAFQDSSLSTKRVELLKSVLPNLSRLAVVWNQAGGGEDAVKAVETAAATLTLQTRAFEVRTPEDLPRAVSDARSWGAQGLIQLASPFITLHRRLLLDALSANAMPASCEMRLYVEDGCLMTYSADFSAMFRDMADYTVRLLAGANPAELPMQQPRHFDFLVNLTTASKLGLTIPAAVRLQMTAGIR